ncbi:2-oxo-hept-4-ene-1,7-dioate hydratase [Rhodobacter ferrooxidans]|uniref:2-oxo-hepta-3-ene-1,7-dioic acid hydratase n=1 Tax=Rhodobacter ferrooxidans TaxID=371731 RepID=C8RX95_9RHOB|nr:2-oxo-hepta-3-ene-1,7-dioic acid hydratase [Rhodobacter sp. SW2]EEW26620.1 2-oxo-hepta-3-ene-1,7-dioic acid hydratase [Rhodobacter sp. SW2]
MTPVQVAEAAAALFAAEQTRVQCGLLSLRYPGMTMDDAYAVQAAFVALKRQAVLGWKIGLTSKAMQSALGIDIPDSGVLLADMLFADGAVVPAGRFIQPRIEAEIAFVMGADLAGDATRDAVLAATEAVVPALEILDTRVQRLDTGTGRARIITDTIADNAANAGIVLGVQRHAPEAFDLRWVGAIVSRDGEVEETGLGAGVLGDPVLGIVWLARRLASYGQQIRAGQVILSGSFIRPVECPPGSRIDADFGGFGRVGCAFA